MNIEEVREYGLSLPHATERCPFGPDTLTLEIGGRMFCLMTLDGRWDFYNLKIDPDYSIELRTASQESVRAFIRINGTGCRWIFMAMFLTPCNGN